MSMCQEVSVSNLSDFVENNPVAVLDFYADWCQPCKTFSKVMDSVSEQVHGVAFGKVNVDKNQAIATQFGIQSIPTVIFFRRGRIVKKEVGAKTETEMINIIKYGLNV